MWICCWCQENDQRITGQEDSVSEEHKCLSNFKVIHPPVLEAEYFTVDQCWTDGLTDC